MTAWTDESMLQTFNLATWFLSLWMTIMAASRRILYSSHRTRLWIAFYRCFATSFSFSILAFWWFISSLIRRYRDAFWLDNFQSCSFETCSARKFFLGRLCSRFSLTSRATLTISSPKLEFSGFYVSSIIVRKSVKFCLFVLKSEIIVLWGGTFGSSRPLIVASSLPVCIAVTYFNEFAFAGSMNIGLTSMLAP